MVEKIDNRLDKAISNLDGNFVENIPLIIEDIYYILFEFDNEKEQLSSRDEFEYSVPLKQKIMKYVAIFSQKYMNEFYGLNNEVLIDAENFKSMSPAGYSSVDKKIYLSTWGFIFFGRNKTNYFSCLFHEYRHAFQDNICLENDFDKLLSAPAQLLLMSKEQIFEDSKIENNRKFYMDNYSKLYYENDAFRFGFYECFNMIDKLLKKYIEYLESNNINQNLDKLNILSSAIKMKMYEECNEEINEKLKVKNISIGYEEAILNFLEGLENYIIDEQEVDRLIAVDKYIKLNPELQNKYPILKILFNGNRTKTYDEIINLMQEELEKVEQETITIFDIPSFEEKTTDKITQVKEWFEIIIKSDPVLYITHLIRNEQQEELDKFIEVHPTVLEEYKDELGSIIKKR